MDVRLIFAVPLIVIFLGFLVQRTPARSTSTWPVIALIGWLALSSLWSPPGADLSGRLLDLGFLACAVLLTGAIASRSTDRVLAALWWMIWATSMTYAAQAVLVGQVTGQGRLTAFGGGPNVFVRVMSVGIIATIALLARYPRNWPIGLAIPIFGYCAVLSGSRGGLVALVLAALAFMVLVLRNADPRTKTRAGLAVVFGAAAFYFVAWDRVAAFVQHRFLEETLGEGYTSGRSEISDQALALFSNHPIIGAGLDGYFASIGHSWGFAYPHNIFLAAASEAGIVGLLLLVGALAVLARPTRALLRSRIDHALLPIAALYFLVASLFSGYWYDTRFIWFFLLIAVGVASSHDPRRSHEGSP